MKTPDFCILCGSKTFRLIFRKNEWCYLRCRNCGLVHLFPRPSREALKENYNYYLPASPREIEDWAEMMQPVISKSADLVDARAGLHGKRLLDIGCGYGFFLSEMKARGWEVEGIEISPPGREYARSSLGLNIHSNPLEGLGLPEDAFDVITLFYVIEHLINPRDILTEVRRILRPDGLLLLRWPHTTPIVRLLGPLAKRLDLYHTPYHLFDFSLGTIKTLLKLTGFREIETRIGGYTRPPARMGRWCSAFFGRFGEALWRLTRGRVLLPGVSKTTLAGIDLKKKQKGVMS